MRLYNLEKRFTVEAGLRKLGMGWCVYYDNIHESYVCCRRGNPTDDEYSIPGYGKRPAEAISEVIEFKKKDEERSR